MMDMNAGIVAVIGELRAIISTKDSQLNDQIAKTDNLSNELSRYKSKLDEYAQVINTKHLKIIELESKVMTLSENLMKDTDNAS